MAKQTTAQVAKALGLTKSRLYKILRYYPALRPVERSGPMVQLLWSEEETAALQAHLAAHPYIRNRRRTAKE